MRLEWNDRYLLGITSIDDQHKKWIEIMNHLLMVRSSQARRLEVSRALEELRIYTEYHFAFEEKIFADLNYTELQLHQATHRDFDSKLSNFLEWSREGAAPMASDLLGEMRDWLIQHICHEDKKYVEFFKLKGVK